MAAAQPPCVLACAVSVYQKKFCSRALRLRWPNRSALPLPPQPKPYAKWQAIPRQNGKGNVSQNGKHIVSRMVSVFPGRCWQCWQCQPDRSACVNPAPVLAVLAVPTGSQCLRTLQRSNAGGWHCGLNCHFFSIMSCYGRLHKLNITYICISITVREFLTK